MQVPQISPNIVREIAQAPPKPGDFRERFSSRQPEIIELIEERLGELGHVPTELAKRLSAAIWAMYERMLEAPMPPVLASVVSSLIPVAEELLASLAERHPGEELDAEWLSELPKGSQPQVIGFLVGALRASRLTLEARDIYAVAAVLFSVAGALESTAVRVRSN